jgi:hypothetical protein
MKNKIFLMGIVVMSLVVGVIVVGCDNSDNITYFSISYDAGEGSGITPVNQNVALGTIIYLPGRGDMLAPSDKSFSGWRTGGRNYDAGDSFKVTDNTSFLACWIRDGGEGGLATKPIPVQTALNEVKVQQEAASSAQFHSANFDPDLGYIVLTYKVGTIKDMFLQYLSTVVVAEKGRTFTYTEIVGHSETEQIENINSMAINISGTVWAAGAGAIAGANVFAGLSSLTKNGPQATANAYAVAGAAAGKIEFDFLSVTTTRYTREYTNFLIVSNSITQDMSIYTAGKKYAVAAFADVGIYQLLKYDPKTMTATAIPGKSLWFNVESRPFWNMYEYSREDELSIPQKLKPFEKINVEVKESDLYTGLKKSVKVDWYVGDHRVDGWYRTDWKLIDLVFPLLKEFGYKTISFEWKTYWAENTGILDCTAHVVLDCADRNLYRDNWSYYDRIVNPGAGWKWVTWNFSSPIGTVSDRPNIKAAYGYDKRDSGFLGIGGKAYYDLSGTVSVTVTAQK